MYQYLLATLMLFTASSSLAHDGVYHGEKYVVPMSVDTETVKDGNWFDESVWTNGVPSIVKNAKINHNVVLENVGFSADFNKDGVVDISDYLLWKNIDPAADTNQDGVVDVKDLVVFIDTVLGIQVPPTTVAHGFSKHVLIEGSLKLVGNLEVNGSVVNNGEFTCHDKGDVLFHVSNDRDFKSNTVAGPIVGLPDFQLDDNGLWCLPGAKLDLNGSYVTPWLNAIENGESSNAGYEITKTVAITGTSSLLSAAPVGWEAGDTILLLNEKGEHSFAVLDSVDGALITYTANNPSFIGNVLTASGKSVYPKVANMSRRVRLISVDVAEGDFSHRAHTLFFGGSDNKVHNVEVRNMGPRAKLGRYPFHIHKGGISLTVVEGCSIWQDTSDYGSRFIAIHDVQNSRIAHNVAFGSQGHGYFMENKEYNNEVIGNLSAGVRGNEELNIVDSDVKGAHHFWLRENNIIEDNVACGNEAIGLVVLQTSGGTPSPVKKMECLGNDKYGIWTFVPNYKFDDCSMVYCAQSGFALSPIFGRSNRNTSINNPIFLLNGLNSPTYESQWFASVSDGGSINGGIAHGRKFGHIHYGSSFYVNGTIIRCGVALTPTYFEFECIYNGVDMKASRMFDNSYSIRDYSMGVFRLVNSTYTVPNLQPNQNLDFTHKSYGRYVAGISFDNAYILNNLLPNKMGHLSLPSDAYSWRVSKTATLPPALYRRPSLSRWNATILGGSQGFPEGTYYVEVLNKNGVSLGVKMVVIQNNAVTNW